MNKRHFLTVALLGSSIIRLGDIVASGGGELHYAVGLLHSQLKYRLRLWVSADNQWTIVLIELKKYGMIIICHRQQRRSAARQPALHTTLYTSLAVPNHFSCPNVLSQWTMHVLLLQYLRTDGEN